MNIPIHDEFAIAIVDRDGSPSIEVRGELDVATAPLLHEQLLAVEAGDASRIVIDLSGVSFMDSSGLRVLLQAHGRSRQTGDRLRITPGREQVQSLFKLAGVLDKLPFLR